MSSFFGRIAASSPITRRYMDGLARFGRRYSMWAKGRAGQYRGPQIGWWIEEALSAVATVVMLTGLLLLIPLAAGVAVCRLLGGSGRTPSSSSKPARP